MAREERSRSGGKTKRFSKTIVIGPFRMAFPALFEPEDTDNGERYKMTCLFPPDYKGMKELEDTLYDAMEADFGPKRDWPNGRNDMTPDDKLYDAGTKKYNGFKEGWWAMSVSSQDAPGIIDADKNEVLSKREVYGGRWARAQVTITTYDNKSKGVAVYLNHVQLLDHDEQFSGKGEATDAFDKYELKDKGRRRPEPDDKDDDRDERDTRRSGRDRDRDDDRKSDDRPSRRGRDEEKDEPESRSRDRGRRSRDEDEEDHAPDKFRDRRSHSDRHAEDRAEGRPSRSRARDDDDEPPRNRSVRSSDRRERATVDDEWN